MSVAFLHYVPLTVGIAAALTAAVLVWLARGSRDRLSAIRELRLELRAAREQAEEYERARRDYATIMRHRVANPLMVVSGGIQTLEALPHLAPADRDDLLAAMAAAADRLADISIDPDPIAVEELGLRGTPTPRLVAPAPRWLAAAG